MAEKNGSKNGKVSIGKSAKISSAQRNMFVAIAGASVVFGITLVGVIYLAKVIKFNAAVIEEKTKANEGIASVQQNLVALSREVEGISTNEYLEAVARQRGEECRGDSSDNDVQNRRLCSALRVIPDSMPSLRNPYAAAASMERLLELSNGGAGVNQEYLAIDNQAKIPPRVSSLESSGLTVMPLGVSFSLNDTSSNVMGALDIIERSIRPYDVSAFNLSWSNNDSIELSATYVGYYSTTKSITINKKVLCADAKSKTCSKHNGVQIGSGQ